MNARMMRKLTALVAEHETAFCIVQHLSVDIGSRSMDPLVLSGGHAIRFAAAIILDLRKRAVLDTDPIKKEDGIKVGVTVKKNHCIHDRNPYVKLDYFAIFGQGIEQYLTLIDKAIKQDILMQSGAFIRDPDENGDAKIIDGFKYQWQGKEKFRMFLMENGAYFEELKARVSGEITQLTEEEMAEIRQEQEVDEKVAKKTKDKVSK